MHFEAMLFFQWFYGGWQGSAAVELCLWETTAIPTFLFGQENPRSRFTHDQGDNWIYMALFVEQKLHVYKAVFPRFFTYAAQKTWGKNCVARYASEFMQLSENLAAEHNVFSRCRD